MRRSRSSERLVGFLVLVAVLVAGTATEAPARLAASQRISLYLQAYKSFGPRAAVCVGESEAISVIAWREKFPAGRERLRNEILGIRIEGRVSPAGDGTLAPADAPTLLQSRRPGAAEFIFTPRKAGTVNLAFNAAPAGAVSWLSTFLSSVPVRKRYFKRTEFDVEVKDCCPGGRAAAPSQEGGVCKANTTINYHWTRVSENSGGSSRAEYTVTIQAKFKVENGYATDDGSTFTFAGTLTNTKLYETPCSGEVLKETFQGGGKFLDFDGSQIGSPFISMLASPGSAVLDATVLADVTGTYIEGDGGGCETKPLEAATMSYTLDCPFHDNSTIGHVIGTYDEESKVANLACSDSTSSDDGETKTTETVDVTGALNLP